MVVRRASIDSCLRSSCSLSRKTTRTARPQPTLIGSAAGQSSTCVSSKTPGACSTAVRRPRLATPGSGFDVSSSNATTKMPIAVARRPRAPAQRKRQPGRRADPCATLHRRQADRFRPAPGAQLPEQRQSICERSDMRDDAAVNRQTGYWWRRGGSKWPPEALISREFRIQEDRSCPQSCPHSRQLQSRLICRKCTTCLVRGGAIAAVIPKCDGIVAGRRMTGVRCRPDDSTRRSERRVSAGLEARARTRRSNCLSRTEAMQPSV